MNDEDILVRAPLYGNIMADGLELNQVSEIQKKLVLAGAAPFKPNLMIMEGRGKVLFPLYADYISKKGRAGSEQRRTRVRIFGIVLPTAIFLLSPLITLISRLVPLIFPGKMRRQREYFQGLVLKE